MPPVSVEEPGPDDMDRVVVDNTFEQPPRLRRIVFASGLVHCPSRSVALMRMILKKLQALVSKLNLLVSPLATRVGQPGEKARRL